MRRARRPEPGDVCFEDRVRAVLTWTSSSSWSSIPVACSSRRRTPRSPATHVQGELPGRSPSRSSPVHALEPTRARARARMRDRVFPSPTSSPSVAAEWADRTQTTRACVAPSPTVPSHRARRAPPGLIAPPRGTGSVPTPCESRAPRRTSPLAHGVRLSPRASLTSGTSASAESARCDATRRDGSRPRTNPASVSFSRVLVRGTRPPSSRSFVRPRGCAPRSRLGRLSRATRSFRGASASAAVPRRRIRAPASEDVAHATRARGAAVSACADPRASSQRPFSAPSSLRPSPPWRCARPGSTSGAR